MEKQEKRETLKELEDWREYYSKKWKQTGREFYKTKACEYEEKVLKLLPPGFTYIHGVLTEINENVFKGLLDPHRKDIKNANQRINKLKKAVKESTNAFSKLGESVEGFSEGIKKFQETIAANISEDSKEYKDYVKALRKLKEKNDG